MSWLSANYVDIITLNVPTGLEWSSPFTASWTASSSPETTGYKVQFYNGSTPVGSELTVTGTSCEVPTDFVINSEGLTFSVKATDSTGTVTDSNAVTYAGNKSIKNLVQMTGVTAIRGYGDFSSNYDADKAIDGSISGKFLRFAYTYAAAANKDTNMAAQFASAGLVSPGGYVGIDLGETKTLGGFEMWSSTGAYALKRGIIIVSVNGTDWMQVAEQVDTAVSGVYSGHYRVSFAGLVEARYIRYLMTEAPDNASYGDILEMAVYSADAALSSGTYKQLTFVAANTKSTLVGVAGQNDLGKLTDGDYDGSATSDIVSLDLGSPLTETDDLFSAQFGTGVTTAVADGDGILRGTVGGRSDGYVEFDLGGVRWIDSFRIFNYKWSSALCGIKHIKVIVSETGLTGDWTEVYENQNVSLTTGSVEGINGKFPLIKARYIRLSVLAVNVGNNTGGGFAGRQYANLYEFMAFGYDTDPSLPTQLGVSRNVAWVAQTAVWSPVSGASSYTVYLYRNGGLSPVATQNVPGSNNYFDFAPAIETNGAGSYTFRVIAVGNGTSTLNSAPSRQSEICSTTELFDLDINVEGGSGIGSVSYFVNGVDYTDVSGFSGVPVIDDKYALGTSISVTVTPAAGYEFRYWVDNKTNKIVCEDETYNFTVGAKTDIKAVIIQSGSASYTVTFLDFNKTVFKNVSVLSGQDAQDPQTELKNTHQYLGYSFERWDKAFTNVQSDLIVKALYKRIETNNSYNVTVKYGNGTPSSVGAYLFDTLCEVTVNDALITSGKVFGGWSINGTDIVSYDRNYSFYVGCDTNLTVILADSAPTATPVISIVHAKTSPTFVSFLSQRMFPATGTNTFVESGVIYSKQAASDLYLSDVNGSNVKSSATSNHSLNGQFMMNISSASSGEIYARAYLIYKDSAGVSHTMYSNKLSALLTTA